jgi:hypothetical protein
VAGTMMEMKKSLSAGTVEVEAGVFVGGGGGDAAAAVAAAVGAGAAAGVGAGAGAGADAGAGAGWDEQLYTWLAKGDVQTPEISGRLIICFACFLSDIFSRKPAELWAFSVRFPVVGRCRGACD